MLQVLYSMICYVFYSKWVVYNSIHNTPAYLWDKNDPYLLVKRGFRLPKWLISKIYENIYNEILLNFPPKDYYKLLQRRTDAVLKQWRAIKANDRNKLTLALIDLEAVENELKGAVNRKFSDFKKNVIAIEKMHGIRINHSKITIFEYLNYLNNGE